LIFFSLWKKAIRMPPKQADPDELLREELAKITRLRNDGLVSEAEAEDMRRVALGLPAAAARPAAANLQVENEYTKSRKELLAALKSLIGTKDEPCIAGKLWDVVSGGTEDDILRLQVLEWCAEHEIYTTTKKKFLVAGDGICPPYLKGDSSAVTELRAFIRVWLTKLAGYYLVSKAFPNGDRVARDKHLKDLLVMLSSENHGEVVLSNLKHVLAQDTVVERLRQRDESPDGTKTKVARTENAKVPSAGRPSPKSNNMTRNAKAFNLRSGVCHNCGGKGHYAAACSSPPKK
jgi:hypothetical protein